MTPTDTTPAVRWTIYNDHGEPTTHYCGNWPDSPTPRNVQVDALDGPPELPMPPACRTLLHAAHSAGVTWSLSRGDTATFLTLCNVYPRQPQLLVMWVGGRRVRPGASLTCKRIHRMIERAAA